MIWKILIIIILVMCFAGARLSELEDIDEAEFLNLTDHMEYDNINLTFQDGSIDESKPFVERAIYKLADLYAFIMLEGMRTSMIFGYYHPQYNFDLAWKLMFASIFAVLIVPFMYITLFIGYGSLNLINAIQNWRKNVKKDTRNNNRRRAV